MPHAKLHYTSHQHGGDDEIATLTPTTNAIPKSGTGGKLDLGWLPDSIQGVGREASPTLHFLGSLLDYTTNGASGAARSIQYARVWLSKDITITQMQTFLTSISQTIIMGMYDNRVGGVLAPEDASGVPYSLLATTAQYTPVATGFQSVDLTAPYQIPTSGYYWLAIQIESTACKVQITPALSGGFIPVMYESPTPGAMGLPSTASPVFASSGVAYTAAKE